MSSADNHVYDNLVFEPDDVTFIIVPDNNDATRAIDFINRNMKENEIAKQTFISKIISYKTIQEDIFSH